MDIRERIRPNTTYEKTFTVSEEHLAQHVGSGSARVLATPWMILFMERTSHQLIAGLIPGEYSSVGTMVCVRHLAPSPLGSTIQTKAEVLSVDGNRIKLKVQAWDDLELIGEGTHERVIIEVARFLRRIAKKQSG